MSRRLRPSISISLTSGALFLCVSGILSAWAQSSAEDSAPPTSMSTTALHAAASTAPPSGQLRSRETPYPSLILPGRTGSSNAPLQVEEERKDLRTDALVSSALPVNQRVEMLSTDTRPLTSEDAREMMAFVAKGALPSEMRANAFHYLANEIWNELGKIPSLQEELLAHLSEQSEQATDAVIRDYAIQHLAEMRLPLALQERQIHLLTQQTGQPGDMSAGTALIGLRKIAERQSDPKQREQLAQQVAEKAFQLAGDPAANDLARITALSMACDYGAPGLLTLARELLADSETHSRLQLVALRVLKEHGQPEDVELLADLATTAPTELHRNLALSGAEFLQAQSPDSH